MTQLMVTRSFETQCLAFPDRVDRMLAEAESLEDVKEVVDKTVAMQKYIEQMKVAVKVARPVCLGVLKAKATLGEWMPRGKVGAGRGNKIDGQTVDFNRSTIAAYRKLADNKGRLGDYYDDIEDVPTQSEFIRWCSGAHVSNNSGECEWYTPEEYIEAARETMGTITLDPASTAMANTVVKATKIYTADDDGLSQHWSGNVWLNPPYAQPLIQQFVVKLTQEPINQACVLVNNATETSWFQTIASAAAAVAFPSGRVKFWHPEREAAPLQGQAILYVGKAVKLFRKHFGTFGTTWKK